MFNSSKQVSSLRKLLTSYSSIHSRQTVFASASIPQHRHFLHDCVQQKWTKVGEFSFFDWFECALLFQWYTDMLASYGIFFFFWQSNVVHVHVNPVEPMPSRLHHRYMVMMNFILCVLCWKVFTNTNVLEINIIMWVIVDFCFMWWLYWDD